jgi:AcrR family transcriptional regulator
MLRRVCFRGWGGLNERWQQELAQQRSSRRAEILRAARELFLERDLPGVTMKDVQQRAGISRVTLYKYFRSIHELAFAIQTEVLRELSDEAEAAATGASGRERLRNYLTAGVRKALAEPHLVRFTALFDHYYRNAYPDPQLQEEYRRFIGSLRGLRSRVEDGVADGSLRSDIEAGQLVHLLAHAHLGMLQRILVRAEILRQESGTDPEAVLLRHVDMLVSYATSEAAR